MNAIFVSCGQFTTEEKDLGKKIVEMTRSITGIDTFFAEQVQDLNGLESNILEALRNCIGFITVLHPRGVITRPDGTTFTRASVWIEQEIAIATYIRLVEKRTIPVIAFVHKSVSLEGLRALLHLNPIPFTHEREVLAALPKLLAERWKTKGHAGKQSGIQLTMEAGGKRFEQGHRIRELRVRLKNDSNSRITTFNSQFLIPRGLLTHWSANYPHEDKTWRDPNYRCFRFTEEGKGAIPPHSETLLFMIGYCFECAVKDTRDDPRIGAMLVSGYLVEAKLWVDDREYSIKRTVEDLEKSATERGE